MRLAHLPPSAQTTIAEYKKKRWGSLALLPMHTTPKRNWRRRREKERSSLPQKRER
jgi:hypothetical protein